MFRNLHFYLLMLLSILLCCCSGTANDAAVENASSAAEPVETSQDATEQQEGPTDEQKQESTLFTLKTVAGMIRIYAMGNSEIGAPRSETYEDLVNLLIEQEYLRPSFAEPKDDWGNLFVYRYSGDPGSTEYTLMSYGADGTPGPEPVKQGVASRPEEDLIIISGEIVQGLEE